jgi:hypothetical protein
VGVRNFVLGKFLTALSARHETVALHSIPTRLLESYAARFDGRVRWESLVPASTSSAATVLRHALSYAQMYWATTRSMQFNLRMQPKGSWRARSMHRAARAIGRVAATPSGIRLLDRSHASAVARLPEVAHYRRLFSRLKPDVLLCSHQRPPVILPVVLAARALGVPTATFIFSWDNLTSKGRMASGLDHYLVWSDLMQRELLTYYRDVSPAQVHIVGTPQFDVYADDTLLWSRDMFCARLQADPSRPLLCYSGGDTGNSPEDHEHVRILLDQIRAGRIGGRPQVVLRPSPVDPGARYDRVRREYPELIFAPPQWVRASLHHWAEVFPSEDDVQFLANLTYHTDVNINLGSTMTLDFAIRDTPVVNVAFDVADPPPFGLSLWDHHYQFEHYRPVVDLGAARFARTPLELAEHVEMYLKDPAIDRESRRALVELEVGRPIGRSSQSVVGALEAIVDRHARASPDDVDEFGESSIQSAPVG